MRDTKQHKVINTFNIKVICLLSRIMLSLGWNLIIPHLLGTRQGGRLWDFAFHQMVYAVVFLDRSKAPRYVQI